MIYFKNIVKYFAMFFIFEKRGHRIFKNVFCIYMVDKIFFKVCFEQYRIKNFYSKNKITF